MIVDSTPYNFYVAFKKKVSYGRNNILGDYPDRNIDSCSVGSSGNDGVQVLVVAGNSLGLRSYNSSGNDSIPFIPRRE